jgi:hypothetical protein
MLENSVPRENCLRIQPLDDKDRIMLSPLHTTMENFFIVMNKQGKWFEYLIEKFPNLGDEKLKE